MANRPDGLSVVGFVCIGAGTLSACCNTYGLVTSAGTMVLGAALGGTEGGQAAQMLSVQREMAIAAGIPAVLGVVVALVLVAGAGLVLSMKPAGRPLLLGALVAAIFLALVEMGISGWTSYRMSSLVDALGAGTAGGGSDPWQGRGVLLGLGLGMGALWMVLKLGVYIPCLVYMLRRETAALFVRTQQISPRGD